MARLAIFLDGGYVDKIFSEQWSVRVDYRKLSQAILREIAQKTPEPIDILRTLFYHCLPYQGNPPSQDEARRYGQSRKFFDALRHIERFEVREGRLAQVGFDRNNNPIFQQKRVDLLLGLDFALLSGKGQITHAAVLSGDSDLLPALDVAKTEGISVWLFHGPRASTVDGKPTYAAELRLAADERVEIDAAFAQQIKR